MAGISSTAPFSGQNPPAPHSSFTQAEVAAHVTVESAVDLAAAIEKLRMAAQSIGMDSSDSLWPRSSVICLMAFCKGVGSCSRKEIAEHYSSAALLLSRMEAPEVCHRVCSAHPKGMLTLNKFSPPNPLFAGISTTPCWRLCSLSLHSSAALLKSKCQSSYC